MRSISVGLVALGLLVGACSDSQPSGPTESASEVLGDAEEGIDGVQSIRVDGNDHVSGDIDYGLDPPAGGKHDAMPWNCGFYDESIPNENVAHDLEHGVVWITYSPDLPTDEVEVIHDLVRQYQKVIASPYPGLADDEAVVATAWARQLRLDSASDPRLEEFVNRYIDGSQSPEAGSGCFGGPLGDPIP